MGRDETILRDSSRAGPHQPAEATLYGSVDTTSVLLMGTTPSQLAASGAAAAATYAAYTYLTWDPRWWWSKRGRSPLDPVNTGEDWEQRLIHGHCAPGFEPVREEFVANFRVRGELGAACCIYYRGVKVVVSQRLFALPCVRRA